MIWVEGMGSDGLTRRSGERHVIRGMNRESRARTTAKQEQRRVFNQRLEIPHYYFDRCLVRWSSHGWWSSVTLLTSEIAHKSRPDEPLSQFAAPVTGMVTCGCDSWERIAFRGIKPSPSAPLAV